ncbi:hypothetical protein P4B35_00160 [Pontiellaceae bacterium B12227]|nr:hypothetical protein [Pontiellaceae bacterium B12227]
MIGLFLGPGFAFGQTLRFEYAPMFYHSRPVTNGITRLSPNHLTYEPEQGYLRSVLEALDISADSQVLVFSSTSFQKNLINPENPRAIYFNDSNYVGWIPGADLLEIISIDPYLGPIFYDIKQNPAELDLHRNNDDCLDCHSSAKTQSVPGLFIRSSYPKGGGRVAGRTTSHRTELAERWGGWYVTGQTCDARHRGNQPLAPEEPIVPHLNISDLSPFFDTNQFLTPASDVLALMVLEHQCAVFNLINRANYRVRLVMNDHQVDPNDPEAELPERVTAEFKRHAPALVYNLLFTGEAELNGTVSGDTGYAEYFSALGPRDEQGRSLRDFDGERRLFKYPCSYMIYSDSFKTLPPAFENEVFRMLQEVLGNPAPNEDFPHLSAEDKKAVYEILKSTVPELSRVWK